MSDLAQKIADAVEVALGDDGHCVVYKADAVRDAIRSALPVAQGEAVGLTFGDAIRIAKGCTDYSGGYRHNDEHFAIYKHGIGTVVNCLEAAEKRGLEDYQVRVLHRIGSADEASALPVAHGEAVGALAAVEHAAYPDCYIEYHFTPADREGNPVFRPGDYTLYAAPPASAPEAQGEAVALSVWYGAMPESNGKTNWTAILCRDGDISRGYTFARSEYEDRVRYEADSMKFLIGENDEEPNILDYDADKHSDYAAPPTSRIAELEREVARMREAISAMQNHLAANMDEASIHYAAVEVIGMGNKALAAQEKK